MALPEGPIQLQVVTPRAAILHVETDDVTLPGVMGEMEVLPGHRPALTALRPGRLIAETKTERLVYYIEGGFAEILADAVVVLADEAERDRDIDLEEARERLKKAEADLAERRLLPDDERADYEKALDCARIRAELAEALERGAE